ncbi:MAG: recombinase family protein [Litorimonas sp.]
MNKPDKGMPAILYARVSSKKQVAEGSGLDSQFQRTRSYAESKGYTVVAMFTDDMTGTTSKRPGMDAMLAFLKQNRGNEHVVIIDDISRIARSVKAHWELREKLLKAGGRLESPSVVFGSDSDSQFLENVLASSAQHFAQKNREQTINRMRARLMNGYYVKNVPPVGYIYVKGNGKELRRNEPLATIVEDALRGFLSGRFGSQGEVRTFLEAQPEFPKGRKGKVTHQRANDVLTNVLYAGMVESEAWGVSRRKGNHPALISYNEFLRIQELLASKGRVKNRKDISKDFIARGVVDCDDCGKPLTACWSRGKAKQFPYYFCWNKECESRRKSIKRADLEDELTAVIRDLQPSEGLFNIASKMFRYLWDYQEQQVKDRIAKLKQELSRIEGNASKMVDRMLATDNETVGSHIEKRIAQLDDEALRTRETIAEMSKKRPCYNDLFEHALTFLANPWKIWENGNYNERRNLLKMVFPYKIRYSRKSGLRTPQASVIFSFLGVEGEMAHRGGISPKAISISISIR